MSEVLLALNGKMRSGKSTVAERLRDEHGFHIISIGNTIKKVANYLIEDQGELQHYLQEVLKAESTEKFDAVFAQFIDLYKKDYSDAVFQKEANGLYVKNESYRKLTQMVATYFRTLYSEDIWMRFIAVDAMDLADKGEKVVCDDLRLKSEKRILEMFGFVIVRLDISKEEQQNRSLQLGEKISDELLHHPTEIDLDDAYFDFRLVVDGLTIDQVYEQVVGYLHLNN